MDIFSVDERATRSDIFIHARLDISEFHALQGHMDNLTVFSPSLIDTPSKAIKTGARHSYARYFLLPVPIRRKFRTDTHDFDNIKCSAVEAGDKLFVVFSLDRKV